MWVQPQPGTRVTWRISLTTGRLCYQAVVGRPRNTGLVPYQVFSKLRWLGLEQAISFKLHVHMQYGVSLRMQSLDYVHCVGMVLGLGSRLKQKGTSMFGGDAANGARKRTNLKRKGESHEDLLENTTAGKM